MESASRPRTTPALLAGALLVLLLPASVGADVEEETPRARWDVLRAESIERLREMADGCGKARVYAGRATACEAILLFDPDDAAARKRLRYKRDAKGHWARSSRWKPPRNMGRGQKRFDRELDAWRTWLLEAVRPLLEATLDPRDAGLRHEILRAALGAAPDDEGLRRANGEVRHTWRDTTRWVLGESQVAKVRRPALRDAGAAAVESVADPRIAEPRREECVDGIAWGQVLHGPRVRVLGTAAPPEMDLQYAYCEAAWDVFRAALGFEDEAAAAVTVYVTKSSEVGNRFLAAQPGLKPATIERLASSSSAWIPGRRAVLVKDASRPWRLEAGPKELLTHWIAETLGLGAADAWLSEGLAHYLTELVTGTRQVFRTGDAAWLGSPNASVNLAVTDDWLGAGHDLCLSDRRPDLLALASKDLRTLTPDEVLYGYCLVAYLLEGRPDACAGFFRAVGETPASDLDAVVRAQLGWDLKTLEDRLVRWLAETTGRIDRD